MIRRLRDVLRFWNTSWSYIGCDSGTGRFRARRKYFIEILPTTVRYVRLRWNDPVSTF